MDPPTKHNADVKLRNDDTKRFQLAQEQYELIIHEIESCTKQINELKAQIEEDMGDESCISLFPMIESHPEQYVNHRGKKIQSIAKFTVQLIDLRIQLEEKKKVFEQAERAIGDWEISVTDLVPRVRSLEFENKILKSENIKQERKVGEVEMELSKLQKRFDEHVFQTENLICLMESSLMKYEQKIQDLQSSYNIMKASMTESKQSSETALAQSIHTESRAKFELVQNFNSMHSSKIYCLGTSLDGQFFATGGKDNLINLWKDANWSQNQSNQGLESNAEYSPSFQHNGFITGHKGTVWSLTLGILDEQNSEKQIIVSGSGDGFVKCWDLATRECIWTGRGHRNEIGGVALSRSCNEHKLIASVADDATIRIWSFRNQAIGGNLNLLRTISDQYPRPVSGVAFCSFSNESPALPSIPNTCDAHSRLVTNGQNSSGNGLVKLFDTETGGMIKAMDGVHNRQGDVLRVIASACGNFAISSSVSDNKIKIWDLRSGVLARDLVGHSGVGVFELKLFGSDIVVSAGLDDKSVCIWDWKHGNCLNKLCQGAGPIWGVAIDPVNGRWISTGGSGGSQISSNQVLGALLGLASSIREESPDNIKVWRRKGLF